MPVLCAGFGGGGGASEHVEIWHEFCSQLLQGLAEFPFFQNVGQSLSGFQSVFNVVPFRSRERFNLDCKADDGEQNSQYESCQNRHNFTFSE